MSTNKDFPLQIQQDQPKVITLFVIVQYSPQRIVKAAAYDSCRRLFQIGSFVDNEHYSNLQALLIQLNPSQTDSNFKVYCILPTIKSERKKLQDKLGQITYQIIEGKTPSDSINTALQFLLKKQLNHYIKEMENKEPLAALSGLLSTLKLQRDQSNKKQYELVLLNLQNYMKLDKSVINALNLFPKQMEKKILVGSGTIYQILNRCKSQIGTRCLKRWMKQPLQQIQIIQQRLDYIQFFIENPAIKTIIQNQLKKLPDLDALYYTYYKVQAGKKSNAQISDLLKIYRVVKSLEDLLDGLQNKRVQNRLANKIIQDISRNVGIIGKVCQMIEKNIVMEGRDNQFYVKPTAQANLAAIAKQKAKVEKQLSQQFQQVQADLNTEVEKVPSATHKYVMEVSKKVIDKIKSRSHYRFLTAKQSKITFTTDKLGKIINSLKILQDQYKKQQGEILKKMFNIVAGYYPVMQQLSSILSQLDVYTSLASMVSSSQQQWCRPRLSKNLKGINMHHPCVKSCIPNNISLQNKKTIVLTGPNMGGKSTYIRTVGVCVFLAHIGCFVPATQFQTPMIDAIITRVGASDMQIKGISTFMSEMLQSSCMLNIATSKSLVLIDELGRGTSTSQGFGLAWGICQYLHQKIGSYCLFATHFHQMTSMADEIDGVINMHTSCKIGSSQIQLQYKVLEGKMEKSYGVQVAKMVGFPQRVIISAQSYLSLYENSQEKQNQINPQTSAATYKIEEYQKKKLLATYQQMHRKLRNQEIEQQKHKIRNQYKKRMLSMISESH